jgi:hypothetical protein
MSYQSGRMPIENVVIEDSLFEGNKGHIGGGIAFVGQAAPVANTTYRNHLLRNIILRNNMGNIFYHLFKNFLLKKYIIQVEIFSKFVADSTLGAVSQLYVLFDTLTLEHSQVFQSTEIAIMVYFANLTLDHTLPKNIFSPNFFSSIVTSNGQAIFCNQATIGVFQSSVYNNSLIDFGCQGYCNWNGIKDDTCSNTCVRDMCTVCNGTNDCLGCDG